MGGHPIWVDGEFIEDPGRELAERTGSIDTLLPSPHSTATYMYDYGDGWEHRLRIVADHPDAVNSPVLLRGRGGITPEDCGGIGGRDALISLLRDQVAGKTLDGRDAEYLSYFVDGSDPRTALSALVDLDADTTQRYLSRIPLEEASPQHESSSTDNLTAFAIRPELLNLLMRTTGETDVVFAMLREADLSPHSPLTTEQCDEIMKPTQGFLRYFNDGVTLTSAGYLPPKAVPAVLEHLTVDLPFPATRESNTLPVLLYREAVTAMRLLRGAKGVLSTTKATRAVLDDPVKMAELIAPRLPVERDEIGRFIALLIMLDLAAQPSRDHFDSPREPGTYSQAVDRITGVFLESFGWLIRPSASTGDIFRSAERTLAFLRGSGVLAQSGAGYHWAPTPAGKAFLQYVLTAE